MRDDDPNMLRADVLALIQLRNSGLLSTRAFNAAKKRIVKEINFAIGEWARRGQDDIMDHLNWSFLLINKKKGA
jgi:hypothetical protein